VSLLERLRRLWSSPPKPDHPLTAEDRDEERWMSADDERARVFQDLAGDDFDPDDDRTTTDSS
jgi:hypothetical protein